MGRALKCYEIRRGVDFVETLISEGEIDDITSIDNEITKLAEASRENYKNGNVEKSNEFISQMLEILKSNNLNGRICKKDK